MKAKNKSLVTNLFLGSLFTMALTSSISSIGIIIDGVVIGHYLGSEAMSVYGIASPLLVFITAISSILASGTQTKCGRFIGEGNYTEAYNNFSTGVLAVFGISILITIVMIFFDDPIIRFLGVYDESIGLVHDIKNYLYGLLPGIPLISITTLLNSMMYIEGNKKLVFYATFFSCFVNSIGDFICALILQSGMLGIAITTSLSYLISTVILLSHYRKQPIVKFRWGIFSFSNLIEIITTGLPKALDTICYMFTAIFLNRLLLLMSGTAAVTALSIRQSINKFYGIPAAGIGMSTLVIASVFYGEEDSDKLKELFKSAIFYGLVITLIITITVCLLAKPLVSIYTKDITITGMAIPAVLAVVALPLYTIGTVILNFYQATGRKLITDILCIGESLVFVCLSAFFLVKIIGVMGVWLALVINEVMVLLVIYIYSWIKCGHMPKDWDDFMTLPKNFDKEAEKRFKKNCENIDDIITCSKEIRTFMLLNGTNLKYANKMSLFVEEMGAIIIDMCFKKAGKNAIDICLYPRNDKWVLCIRDNCKMFNPNKWYEYHNNNNPEDNLGIKILFRMAEDIEYNNVLNLNSLIIKVNRETSYLDS